MTASYRRATAHHSRHRRLDRHRSRRFRRRRSSLSLLSAFRQLLASPPGNVLPAPPDAWAASANRATPTSECCCLMGPEPSCGQPRNTLSPTGYATGPSSSSIDGVTTKLLSLSPTSSLPPFGPFGNAAPSINLYQRPLKASPQKRLLRYETQRWSTGQTGAGKRR